MQVSRSPEADTADLPVAMLQDSRLSYAARGLLAAILSDPDAWDGTAESIWLEAKQRRGKRKGEGRQAIRATLRELEQHGYLVRCQTNGPGGHLTSRIQISDTSRPEMAEQVKSEVWPLVAEAPSGPRLAYVYRHWDADDRLLYIGMTVHVRHRESRHAKSSRWMLFHARTTTQRFDSEQEAARAEWDAIADEQPLFNIDGNDTPDARRRLAEYLAEGDRTGRYLEPPSDDSGTDVQMAWWKSCERRIADVLGGFAHPKEQRGAAAGLSGGELPGCIVDQLRSLRDRSEEWHSAHFLTVPEQPASRG